MYVHPAVTETHSVALNAVFTCMSHMVLRIQNKEVFIPRRRHKLVGVCSRLRAKAVGLGRMLIVLFVLSCSS
jgi:hypothetical protein